MILDLILVDQEVEKKLSSVVPQLPSWVSTILITGAGGFVGSKVAQIVLDRYPQISLSLTNIAAPLSLGPRTKALAGDLCDPSQVQAFFEEHGTVDAVIALQGIMSGGSEANFNLGYKVTVESHRIILEGERRQGAK